MSQAVKKPPVIVIFGITGDLSQRKLLPALYHLIAHDLLEKGTKLVGISRRQMSVDSLLEKVELCVLEAENVCDPVMLQKLREMMQMVQVGTNTADYQALSKLLDTFDESGQRERLMYMAIPPDAYSPIIQQLGAHGLNDQRTRLLIEKPFGHDTASAKELITVTNEHFDESQIYRIDHYLAKETAQNLLAFRLHNPIFTNLWSGEHIEKICVRAFETIDIEGRVEFYEQTGAMRDIIQSHLMQLLAIVMMDQPSSGLSENIHEGKLALLKSIAKADPKNATRGQYKGYKADVNNPESSTETYARLELYSGLSRWQDTTIILETGKALDNKLTEVIVQFKHSHEKLRNQIRFRLQPNEGISLDLAVKVPGFENRMKHTELNFSYKTAFDIDGDHPDAYERVIMDAVRGDQSLFTASEELLTCWEIVQPVLDAWQSSNTSLIEYDKGASNLPGQ